MLMAIYFLNLVLPTLKQDFPNIQGDGFEEQVAGGNVITASGITGQATIDDFIDMATTLKKKGNMISGYTWVMVTGADGF